MEGHLGAVAELVGSTAPCPGVSGLHLPTPKGVCHTNGLTCSWSCSDEGSIFKSGLHYGRYETITNCPKANEVEGRAFCEKHCVRDVHCVGFTFHVGAGECLLMLDVLDAEFSPAPALAQEHLVYSCFIHERQALVDKFRDPAMPTLDQSNLGDHWYEENSGGENALADENFYNCGLDEQCEKLCDQHTSSTDTALSQEFWQEPDLAPDPQRTEIDACGCAPSTGWCAEDGMCEAGQLTDAEEAACCAAGKKIM